MAPKPKYKKYEKTVLPNLPHEVWCIIFTTLPKESQKNAASTCKLWFEIIRGDSRFSGNVTIPWIELQDPSFNWNNWPSLKKLAIADSSFPSPKMALEAMRDIDFKKCQNLEKVTFGVNFDVAELSRIRICTTTKTVETTIMTAITGKDTIIETEKVSTSKKHVRKFKKEIGTVLALVFNPKSDREIFKLEHVDKLEIHLSCLSEYKSNDMKKYLEVMTMIGEAAKNIRCLIVGERSFECPSFFETGFKSFGPSLKVLTLKNDSFYHCYEEELEEGGGYIDSVNLFFKSLLESCPNLNCLNLGSAFDVGFSTDSSHQLLLLSMAGFKMVNELNNDFHKFCYEWFFDLLKDCTKIAKSCFDVIEYWPGRFSKDFDDFDAASVRVKIKNLKKCQISLRILNVPLQIGCKEYTTELAKDLDEEFADSSTEIKVFIQEIEGTEDIKCFQIIKMPFKNSVITKLECTIKNRLLAKTFLWPNSSPLKNRLLANNFLLPNSSIF